MERLAETLIAYYSLKLDRDWLITFLQSADYPYPEATADRLFPGANEEFSITAVTIDFPPPPLSTYRPPTVAGFVGRSAELDFYRTQLESRGIAIIAGMAGVGKSSLGSMLASATGSWKAVFGTVFTMQI